MNMNWFSVHKKTLYMEKISYLCPKTSSRRDWIISSNISKRHNLSRCMKKFYCIIIGIIFFSSNFSFAEEPVKPVDTRNEVANFYAKIKKDRIRLYWVISNPDDIKEIRLETKKLDDAGYTPLDPVQFSDFIEKEVK